MIYLVSAQQQLFNRDEFKLISVEESLDILSTFTNNMVQLDTETTGLNHYIDKCLLLQLGNIEGDIQVVIDTSTINPKVYKEFIENSFVIGQNLKFDCQVLYAYDIYVRNCYDTMIVELLLYLGFPDFMIGASEDIIMEYCRFIANITDWDTLDKKERKQYLQAKVPRIYEFISEHSGVGLKALCYRYLNVHLSKEIRGQIIWRGVDPEVILYAARDVQYLYPIMQAQLKRLRELNMTQAAKTECLFVPVAAYYEWCGVHMDVPLWQKKMAQDEKKRTEALNKLNQYVCDYGDSRFFKVNKQGDLFLGYDTTPKCTINWNSPKQVIPFLTLLGFNCKGIDKKTKKEKDSLEASVLAPQRHVNPEFYDIYLAYSEADKVCTTYGQNYLNAINPLTDRVHSTFRTLGTDTGRLACGSQEQNISLAKLKGLPTSTTKDTTKKCAYPQLQNLPKDALTRACFCAEKGNSWISIDYNGQESVLMADFSKDQAMLNVFLEGGDMHSTVAYIIYPEEIPRDFDIKKIKKTFPELRQHAKGPEFCFAYAGNDSTLVQQYGMDPQVAKNIYDNYMKGFPGIAKFQQSQKKFVVNNGYILISPVTGHRAFWWDWKYWKEVGQSHTPEFWEEYRQYHKGTGDEVAKAVSTHFKAKTKWEKNACNSPLQGTGAIIFKRFNKALFDWVVDNGYFNVVKFCIPAHDEINVECPSNMAEEVVQKIQKIMTEEAQPFLKILKLDSEVSRNKDGSLPDHWVH